MYKLGISNRRGPVGSRPNVMPMTVQFSNATKQKRHLTRTQKYLNDIVIAYTDFSCYDCSVHILPLNIYIYEHRVRSIDDTNITCTYMP